MSELRLKKIQLGTDQANQQLNVTVETPATADGSLLIRTGPSGGTGSTLVTMAPNGTLQATAFEGDGSALTGVGSTTTIVNDNSTNANRFITFSNQTSGEEETLNVSSSKLTFNPSSGTLSATSFVGDGSQLTGLAGGTVVSNDTTTNATRFITFSDQTSGTEDTLTVSSTKLTFNPSNGELFATVFNSSSDVTLKDNIETATGVEVVEQLRGVEFDWKDGSGKSSGVIAQEVEEVLPHLVSEGESGKSVQYDALVAYLIESVKELSARVKELESK